MVSSSVTLLFFVRHSSPLFLDRNTVSLRMGLISELPPWIAAAVGAADSGAYSVKTDTVFKVCVILSYSHTRMYPIGAARPRFQMYPGICITRYGLRIRLPPE